MNRRAPAGRLERRRLAMLPLESGDAAGHVAWQATLGLPGGTNSRFPLRNL
jgi:hypothetical protein